MSRTADVVALVRGLVHDGRLREGDVLPSTRALAAELGVSRGTVVAAYEQLDGEGYLVTRQGAVSRVAATIARDGVPGPAPPAAPGAGPGGLLRLAGGRSVDVDLRPGLPRASALDERDWRAALRHAAGRPMLDEAPDCLGTDGLRTQIAVQTGLTRGFAPDPERVLVVSGTSDALSLVTEALARAAGRAVRVAVENPGYATGQRAITSAGGVLVPVAVTDHGMDLGALRAAHARRPVDAVVVTPSHQYPMGGALPLAERVALCAWAAAEGVVVVEDDYDSQFRHRGAPLPALAAVDRAGVVVHLGSFSKILSPGLRCGYVVLPDGDLGAGVRDAVVAARSARGGAVATVVQDALSHLLASGALRRHLARVRRDYAHKRALVDRELGGLPGVRLRALDGGLHAVLEVIPRAVAPRAAAGGAGSAVADALAARGVLVSDLRSYVVPGSGLEVDGIVLGYGPVPASVLVPALAAVREEVLRALAP